MKREYRAEYVRELQKLSKEELARELVKVAEYHEESDDWQAKQNYGDNHDFILALGNFLYGKEEFEKAWILLPSQIHVNTAGRNLEREMTISKG